MMRNDSTKILFLVLACACCALDSRIEIPANLVLFPVSKIKIYTYFCMEQVGDFPDYHSMYYILFILMCESLLQ